MSDSATQREIYILGLGDDTSRGDVVRSYLAEAGYRSRPASVAELAEAKPLGALLDLSPYSDDGWNILLEIKKDPAVRDVPVLPVFLSEEGKVAGVFPVAGFFTLPVDREYLAKKLAVLGLADEVDTYDLQVMMVSRRGEETVEKALVRMDFEVVNAYTGREAVALASITPPYLSFVSLGLPDMTAFELLDRFRLYPTLRNLPFFVMMKETMTEGERKAMAKEIAHLVRKKELTAEEFLAHFRRR